MSNETWEMTTLDWTRKGDHDEIVSPTNVAELIFAKNKQQARDALLIVEGAVGQNGVIYPCALTIVKTVLAALPNCSLVAKYDCLHLIAQITASESAPDSPNIAKECLIEIRQATWYFIYGLQFDDVELACLYVDILGCLGERFEDLRATAVKYIKLALTRNLPHYDIEMIENTIAGLSN